MTGGAIPRSRNSGQVCFGLNFTMVTVVRCAMGMCGSCLMIQVPLEVQSLLLYIDMRACCNLDNLANHAMACSWLSHHLDKHVIKLLQHQLP